MNTVSSLLFNCELVGLASASIRHLDATDVWSKLFVGEKNKNGLEERNKQGNRFNFYLKSDVPENFLRFSV